ncbi:MAG TPA: class I mannose-6-phosphate isomerase [Candidatus Alistipes faecavium]|uniref:class I mannose-6-phosphate isomerase n=1 Tax=uncultured Alistipes sp. TaxID=538949 RepID=UPI001F8D58B6|nr:class I mannose-6-phosphate isomerase [uncultured Alistipes sp.]HJA97719.1 class I mannose-6-phosphate isomerase [Candidatus Alistipes faecavium]
MNTCRFTRSDYDKFPATETQGPIWRGWTEICSEIALRTSGENALLVFDTYHGVYDAELTEAVGKIWPEAEWITTESLFHDEAYLRALTEPYVTDDELFGYLSPLGIADYFDPARLAEARERIRRRTGRVIVYGCGAGYVAPNADLTLYADMARWEIQQRFRAHAIHGLGVDNSQERPARQYKRGYFNDWPVLDNHKKSLYHRVDYWIDTHHPGRPLMIAAETFMQGIARTVRRPFRVVPFFDPAPWGGQWMKEVCDLDRSRANFGWCFDCVPEENSLLLSIDGERFEMPAQNLVYLRPEELLGAADRQRFGESFPIRFDFLDTIGGGNLSLQVHPTNSYIRRTFGMRYTQDESYYLLDAEPGACVYLGLRRGVDPERMLADLRRAQEEGVAFDAERYVNRFPAQKHDHYLIPAGTIHCSGAGAMVLEISATPNIFTFKMWDWGRMGLDGKPRPINIGHASHVINWSRDTDEILRRHCNCFEPVASGEGWREERTGLHEAEFIETRRHWFTVPVQHDTCDGVQVFNLIEGAAAVVESPTQAFEPFTVHYAETFIIPASVGRYTIRPLEPGASCGTIKAYVRH